MVPQFRKQFNEAFSQEKYEDLKKIISAEAGCEAKFRISESPVFLPAEFRNKLEDACESIISQIGEIPGEIYQKAVPEKFRVPNDHRKPHFLTIDFAICKDKDGNPEPQLIELQAFPTLYAYQKVLEDSLKRTYPFTSEFKTSAPQDEYFGLLKKVIIADEDPENVALLEIYPERQKTDIDFALTSKYLGIKTLCISDLIKKGNQLFYEENGHEIQVKRIYNRVIFDELERYPELQNRIDLKENLDVEWVTHPNWFFKISKFILPFLHHEFIPKSYYLSDFPNDENPENFVLKPLFSFAGAGVQLNPSREDLEKIQDKENFIMQRKVVYEPYFQDVNGEFAKAEIRLLYLWPDEAERPILVQNLARMTKSEMANVDFTKRDLIWTGSSIVFFSED